MTTKTEERLIYTIEEAAKLLGISQSLAYKGVKRNEIPHIKVGHRVLVPKAMLERFLSSKE